MAAALTMTKGDWDKMLNDDAHWDQLIYEEAVLVARGEPFTDLPVDLEDKEPVTIKEGVVVHEEKGTLVRSLSAHAKRWQKKSALRNVVVSVPSRVSDSDLRKALAVVGGKIA